MGEYDYVCLHVQCMTFSNQALQKHTVFWQKHTVYSQKHTVFWQRHTITRRSTLFILQKYIVSWQSHTVDFYTNVAKEERRDQTLSGRFR